MRLRESRSVKQNTVISSNKTHINFKHVKFWFVYAFYDEQSESTCLFVSFYSLSLSLSLSLSRIRDIISKPVIIDSPKCKLNRLIKNN